MSLQALIILIIVGAIAGWLAGIIVKGVGFGLWQHHRRHCWRIHRHLGARCAGRHDRWGNYRFHH